MIINRSALITVLTSLSILFSCAPKEKLEPIYQPVDYKFETITLNIPTEIDGIPPIEITGIRKFIYKIPLLNRLLSIPLDLTGALLPALPVNEYLEVPEDDAAVWTDPEFLSMVRSFKIKKAWLREKTKSEIIESGHKLNKKKSFFCGEKGIGIIHEMNVKFEYTDKRFPHLARQQFPIAYTNNSKKFLKKEKNDQGEPYQIFYFQVLDEDLRPFIDDVRNFRLKLETKGKLPCERVFIQAGLEVQVVLEVKAGEKAD